MSPGEVAVGAPAPGKSFDAELRVAWLRVMVIVQADIAFFAFMDRAQTRAGLVYGLIALSWVYALWMLLTRPYRRWPLLVSGYYTAITDVVFISLWVYATGGRHSPFYVTAYLSVFAVAFRYTAREAIFAACFYDAAYLGLLAATGELGVDRAETFTRLVYVFLAARIGALLVGQVDEQAVAASRALGREKRSRADAVAAESRAVFLAEASKALASSLDYEQTLKNVAGMVVPRLGDICVVDVRDADGVLHRVAEAAADPAHEALLLELRKFPMTDESLINEAARNSETIVLPKLDDAGMARVARGRGDGFARIIRQLGAQTLVTVPLRVHGQALGTVSFGTCGRAHEYTAEELRLTEEIALRAALAIEHARLYRDSREAVRKRDEFLSIASHELRTPLNVMLLQTDGLLRQAKKEDDARLVPALERIKRQVSRLGSLIESLLDVSRIAAGRFALDLAEVDLGTVVDEVVARLRDEAGRAGATIDVARGAGVVGRWDRLRVDQIVTNLLANAIKYGSGKPIQVTIVRAGDQARLQVTDHGIGIGEQDQARIFERFERAVSTRHYGGFGLGLWIVRQILEAHGGTIAITSRLGEGSTFVAELPLAGPRLPSSPPPPMPPSPQPPA